MEGHRGFYLHEERFLMDIQNLGECSRISLEAVSMSKGAMDSCA